jgi:hypothetical protein
MTYGSRKCGEKVEVLDVGAYKTLTKGVCALKMFPKIYWITYSFR